MEELMHAGAAIEVPRAVIPMVTARDNDVADVGRIRAAAYARCMHTRRTATPRAQAMRYSCPPPGSPVPCMPAPGPMFSGPCMRAPP